MKTILRFEYAALLLLGLFVFSNTGFSWWWFGLLFFLPDLSMLGYVINSKFGAVFYNFFHHFATAVLMFLAGKLLTVQWMEIAGIILFSHAAFDRLLGYGLKYPDSFSNTHLGKIGKKKALP